MVASLCFVHVFYSQCCTQQITQDATCFPVDPKIKVMVSGDGAKFSQTSSFVLLSYTILMHMRRAEKIEMYS